MITLPITYHAQTVLPESPNMHGVLRAVVTGATPADLAAFGEPSDPIRQIERASIRAFVEKYRHLLTGRVLDFGAGKPGTCRQPEPYRDLVSGEYVPYDKGDHFPVSNYFDAILCTQVIEYFWTKTVDDEVSRFWQALRRGGHLILTYATCYPPTGEGSDRIRFTPGGIELLFAGWHTKEHVCRAIVKVGSFEFPLGYGIVLRKP